MLEKSNPTTLQNPQNHIFLAFSNLSKKVGAFIQSFIIDLNFSFSVLQVIIQEIKAFLPLLSPIEAHGL